MLQRRDHVSHFEVTKLDGSRARYADLWQRRNLLLVLLPDPSGESGRGYVSRLAARWQEFAELDTECIITSDVVPGAPRPGVVIADRWGEIEFVRDGHTAEDLPHPDELVEWLRGIQHECPECQGEAR